MNTNRSILLKADSLLLNHYINRLPLTLDELENIAKDMGWLLDTYQEAAELIKTVSIESFVKEHKALTTIFGGQTVILYDGQLPYSEKLQYICHEMGHIVLRHTTENSIVGLCADLKRMMMQEEEADAFAAEMMAPACVMRDRGITNLDELIKTHLISEEQAVRHASNLAHEADTAEEKQLCAVINHKAPLPQKKSKKLLAAACAAIGATIATVMAISALVPRQAESLHDVISSSAAVTSGTPTTSASTSSTSTEPVVSEDVGADSDSEITVYVTAKGKKYHKPDCYHISGKTNLIKLTVEEAERAGYEPCKDCF